jgi:hypothetical protein
MPDNLYYLDVELNATVTSIDAVTDTLHYAKEATYLVWSKVGRLYVRCVIPATKPLTLAAIPALYELEQLLGHAALVLD